MSLSAWGKTRILCSHIKNTSRTVKGDIARHCRIEKSRSCKGRRGLSVSLPAPGGGSRLRKREIVQLFIQAGVAARSSLGGRCEGNCAFRHSLMHSFNPRTRDALASPDRSSASSVPRVRRSVIAVLLPESRLVHIQDRRRATTCSTPEIEPSAAPAQSALRVVGLGSFPVVRRNLHHDVVLRADRDRRVGGVIGSAVLASPNVASGPRLHLLDMCARRHNSHRCRISNQRVTQWMFVADTVRPRGMLRNSSPSTPVDAPPASERKGPSLGSNARSRPYVRTCPLLGQGLPGGAPAATRAAFSFGNHKPARGP